MVEERHAASASEVVGAGCGRRRRRVDAARRARLRLSLAAVRIVEGFGVGGRPDLLSRLIGQWLSQRLGQPFIIENKTVAAGNIATETVVKSAPDGYTLLTCLTANAINGSLYPNLDFNFLRDIVPVAGLIALPMVFLVDPSFPAKTLQNSSPTPRLIRARSTWRRPASARRCRWPAN